MTAGHEDAPRQQRQEASGDRAVTTKDTVGIISTSDEAGINSPVDQLPPHAFTPAAELPAPAGMNNLPETQSSVFVGGASP